MSFFPPIIAKSRLMEILKIDLDSSKHLWSSDNRLCCELPSSNADIRLILGLSRPRFGILLTLSQTSPGFYVSAVQAF